MVKNIFEEEILIQEELEGTGVESKKEDNSVIKILKWFGKNLKFLLIPSYRLKELTEREKIYERTISKRKFISRLKSALTIFGIIIIIFIVTLAFFADWLAPYTYEVANGHWDNDWASPSPENLLGTTKFGRDILSRIIYGARSSLTIALPAILFSVVFGVVFGVIAGYYGGRIDSVIMRIMDIFLAFPGLILAIVFIAIWGQKMEFIMLAYGILGIPYYSRLIRGSVIQARQLSYVNAAKTAGASKFRIMFKHILPNCIQPIIISLTFDIGGVILSLAGLSFLGFSDSNLIEWGNDIAKARLFIFKAPWAAFWPGIMILITVLGFMLVGDGLRDALDPKLKNL